MWIGKRVLCIAIGILGIVLILALGGVVVSTMASTGVLGVVIIDPGHGGYDGGVAVGNVKEADINLEMSRMLAEELSKRNIKAILTRQSDKALGDTKKEDMARRAEIIAAAKPDIVVSMHVNKWSDSSRRGVQVFYDDTGRGEALATQMQSLLNTYINGKYAKRTDLACQKGDYFITKCQPCPSIIVENGFISNTEDRGLLGAVAYRQEVVDAIVKGIEAVLKEAEFS